MADSTLISRAEQIRTETGEGKNTPERVGSLLVDMCKADEAAAAAATAAQSAASAAQETADGAKTAASAAQETADGAKTAASAAQETAEAASAAASSAQSAAQTAQETADGAKTAASAAQETAGGAKTAASAAQETADGAKTAASAAQETADGAKTAASAAQETAEAASAAASSAQSAAQTAQETADGAKSKAEGNAAAISSHAATLSSHTETLASHTSELADHETRVTALEEGGGTTEAKTEVVAVAKAAGGTITIGTHTLTLAKGTNRFSLPSGQEGIALNADAKAGLVSLSLTGAKVKARATDLQALFNGNATIHSLHLPALDVSAVTTLYRFAPGPVNVYLYGAGASKLTRVTGIEDWDTSAVSDFYGVFGMCTALQSADLTRWDTSAATSLASLFGHANCPDSLTFVGDLSGWDTGKCQNFSQLFAGCTLLKWAGDLGQWDMSSATTISSMFIKSGFTRLSLAGWDTRKVTDMAMVFHGCTALTEVDASGWDLRSLTSGANNFCNGCTALTSLKLGEGWGRIPGTPTLALSPLTKWTGDTVKTLLELYDRTQDETLGTMTINLSANTYTALGADNISALTEKGYTITK